MYMDIQISAMFALISFAQYCGGENRQFRNLSCVSVTLSQLCWSNSVES